MNNTNIAPFKTLLIYNAQNPSLIIHVELNKIKELKITIPFGTAQKDLVLQPIEIENIHKTRAFHYEINKDELSIKSLESGGEILTKIEITNLKLNPYRVNAFISIQNENDTYILPIENYNAFVNSFYACTTDSTPKILFELTDVDVIQLNWNGHKDCTYELVVNKKTIKNVKGFTYNISPDDLKVKNICQLKAKYNGQPAVEIIKQWGFEIKKPDLRKIKLFVKSPKYYDRDYVINNNNRKISINLHQDFINSFSLDMQDLKGKDKGAIYAIYLNENLIYQQGQSTENLIKIDKNYMSLFTANNFTVTYNHTYFSHTEHLGVFYLTHTNFIKSDFRNTNLLSISISKENTSRIIEEVDQTIFTHYNRPYLDFKNGLELFKDLLEVYKVSINNHSLYDDSNMVKASFKVAYEKNINNIRNTFRICNEDETSLKLNYSVWYLNLDRARLFFKEGLNTIEIKFRLPTFENIIYTQTTSFIYKYLYELEASQYLYDKNPGPEVDKTLIKSSYGDSIYSDNGVYMMKLDNGILRLYHIKKASKQFSNKKQIPDEFEEQTEESVVLVNLEPGEKSSMYFGKDKIVVETYKILDKGVNEERSYNIEVLERKFISSYSFLLGKPFFFKKLEASILKITNEGKIIVENYEINKTYSLKELIYKGKDYFYFYSIEDHGVDRSPRYRKQTKVCCFFDRYSFELRYYLDGINYDEDSKGKKLAFKISDKAKRRFMNVKCHIIFLKSGDVYLYKSQGLNGHQQELDYFESLSEKDKFRIINKEVVIESMDEDYHEKPRECFLYFFKKVHNVYGETLLAFFSKGEGISKSLQWLHDETMKQYNNR